MYRMQPRRGWNSLLVSLLVTGILGSLLAFISGGCTVRVEGFHRPETELRTIVQEECLRAILSYQQYLERERETNGTSPMKPVS